MARDRSHTKVSIVIPTYQRRDVVNETVQSLVGQAERYGAEIVVVIDGSTDDTDIALRALGAGCVRIIRQANSGAAAARNAGARSAIGEVLVFLDDDMRAGPGLIDAHVAAHEAGADAVLGRMTLDPSSPPTYLAHSVGRWSDELDEQLSALPAIIDGRQIFSGHLSVRRQIFEELGGFDATYTRAGRYGNEDLDFGARLVASGAIVRYTPAAVTAQYYDVTAREYLRRIEDLGTTDGILAERTEIGRTTRTEALAQYKLRRRWAKYLLSRRPRVLAAIAWPSTISACRAIDAGKMDRRTCDRFWRSASIAYHVGVWRSAHR